MTMKPIRAISSPLAALLLLALAGACSHDAKRSNPLDPELTPPVELSVALNDTAGTASVIWTAYEGAASFAGYRLIRNIEDRTTVDTLANFSAIDSTTFVDNSLAPDVVYTYRVLVLNDAGFEVASQPRTGRLSSLPPVQIQLLEFNSATASAEVKWSSYVGRDFAGYRVMRTVGEDTRILEEFGARTDTVYVDTGLRGNTNYSYSIVVLTEHGNQLASRTQSGSIHAILGDPWATLDIDSDFVRLYAEEPDRLTALTTNFPIRLITYNPNGEVLQTQASFGTALFREAVTSAIKPDGGRLVAIVQSRGGHPNNPDRLGFITELDSEGSRVWVDREMFAGGFADPLGALDPTVAQSVGLWEDTNIENNFWTHVVVSAPRGLVLDDDLSDGFSEAWQPAVDHSPPVSAGIRFGDPRPGESDLEFLGQYALSGSGNFRAEASSPWLKPCLSGFREA